MKKVVFLVPSLRTGGMERVLVNYANLFVKRGYDVTVFNFTYDDPGIVSEFNKDVKYFKYYMPVKNLWHSTFKSIIKLDFRLLPWGFWIKYHSSKFLYRKYFSEKFDVEIAFFGSEAIKIVSGSKNPNSVAWIHNVNVSSYIKPLGSYKNAQKVYNDINKIVCVSNDSKQEIEKVFHRNKDVYVINNPNDTLRIRELSVKETIKTNGIFTFVMVARFSDISKGFIRLLDVCKKLIDQGYCFNLWLVGDGMDYSMVKNRSNQLRLSNVTFWGKKDNPYPYIKSADMYLCSSYYEGFSMVMMEAIILGKPLLTTDVSGADEMLDGGKYGMIVENSEEGLYQGMKAILTDPELFQHYCRMADERKDFLNEDRIMDQVEKILMLE